MRYLCTLLLTIAIAPFLRGQDTIFSTTDTLICTPFADPFTFENPYDTLLYTASWYLISDPTAAISLEQSTTVADQDTLLLINTPAAATDAILVDTLIVQLRFFPEVSYMVNPPQCFDGDSVSIVNTSQTYGDYTSVSYSINDQVFSNPDAEISVWVPNGDSVLVTALFTTEGCSELVDTTLTVATRFTPELSFEPSLVCFGDSTTITDNSLFDENSATFMMTVEGLTTFSEIAPTYSVLLPDNTDVRNVFVEVDQEGCAAFDTFTIANKLLPSAGIELTPTCENEFLSIINASANVAPNASYAIAIGGNTYTYAPSPTFTLPDTLPHGVYDLSTIVENNNGCSDTLSLTVTIDSVTYVTFTNLDEAYCENQDVSLLQANVNSGTFSGPFITDLLNGTADFIPTDTLSDFEVIFSFTNALSCTDTYRQTVDIVHPKPQLVLAGLASAYCEADEPTILSLNQTIEANSIFEVSRDDTSVDQVTSLTYVFDPVLSGSYEVLNIYTDENGCFDSLRNFTVVNPLPMVEVDSLTTITPGEFITIGNTGGPETNVDYLWSNGSNSSSTSISEPGIYVITAFNTVTGCEAADTARLQYDSEIETDLLTISIGPNPTSDQLTIQADEQISGIMIINAFGETVTVNGQSTLATDLSGMLTLSLATLQSGYYYILIPNLGNFLIIKI